MMTSVEFDFGAAISSISGNLIKKQLTIAVFTKNKPSEIL